LGTAAAVILLVLAGWRGTRGRPPAAGGPPAPAPETVASAVPPSPVFEAELSAAAIPPVPPAPPDDAVADAPPPQVVSPPPQPSPWPRPPAPAPAPGQEPQGPQPPAATPGPPAPEPAPLRRRSDLSEDDLRQQLAAVPEFGLSPAVRQALVRSYATQCRG